MTPEKHRELAQQAAAEVEQRYERLRQAIKVRTVDSHSELFDQGVDISNWPVLEGLARRELARGVLLQQQLELLQRRHARLLKKFETATGRAQPPGETEPPMALKALKNANKVRPPEPPAPPPPPPPPVSTEPPTVEETLADLRIECAELRDHTGNTHVERLVDVVDRLIEAIQEATKSE